MAAVKVNETLVEAMMDEDGNSRKSVFVGILCAKENSNH